MEYYQENEAKLFTFFIHLLVISLRAKIIQITAEEHLHDAWVAYDLSHYDTAIQEAQIATQINDKLSEPYKIIFMSLDQLNTKNSLYYTSFIQYYIKTRNQKMLSKNFDYFLFITDEKLKNQLIKEAIQLFFINLKGDDTKVNQLFQIMPKYEAVKSFLKQGNKQVKYFLETYRQALQDKKKQLSFDISAYGSLEQQIMQLKDDLSAKDLQEKQRTILKIKYLTQQLLKEQNDDNQHLLQILPCLFLCLIGNEDTEINIILIKVMNKVHYYKAIDSTCKSIGDAIKLQDPIIKKYMLDIKHDTAILIKRQKFQAAYYILSECDQQDNDILEQLSICEVKLNYMQSAIQHFKTLMENYIASKQYDKFLMSQQFFVSFTFRSIRCEQLFKILNKYQIKSLTSIITSNDTSPQQFYTQNTQLTMFIYGYKYLRDNQLQQSFDYNIIDYIYPFLITFLLKECKINGWNQFQPINRAIQLSFECQKSLSGCQFSQQLNNIQAKVEFKYKTGKNFQIPIDVDWEIADNVVPDKEELIYLTEKIIQYLDENTTHCYICRQYRKLCLLFILSKYIQSDLIEQKSKYESKLKLYKQQIKQIAQQLGYDEITYKELLSQFLLQPNINQVAQLVDMSSKNNSIRVKIMKKIQQAKIESKNKGHMDQQIINLAYYEVKLQSKNLQIKELQECYKYFQDNKNSQIFQQSQKELKTILLNILFREYKSRVQIESTRQEIDQEIKRIFKELIMDCQTYEDYYNIATIAGFELGAQEICYDIYNWLLGLQDSRILCKTRLFVPVNQQMQTRIKFNMILLQQQMRHFETVEYLQSEL